jgi:hypothetical protein
VSRNFIYYNIISILTSTVVLIASSSSLANLLNHTLIINMNIQPIRLVVHRAHAVRLEDAVLLGEVVLRERLVRVVSNVLPCMHGDARGRTISSCESPIFLPMSLFIQSSPEEPPSLDIRPGTTRGILSVRVVVVRVRLVRRLRIVMAVWW